MPHPVAVSHFIELTMKTTEPEVTKVENTEVSSIPDNEEEAPDDQQLCQADSEIEGVDENDSKEDQKEDQPVDESSLKIKSEIENPPQKDEIQETTSLKQKELIDELVKTLPPEDWDTVKESNHRKIHNKKENHKYVDDNDLNEFIKYLLAVKKHRVILIEEDIITKEESAKRITWAQMAIAMLQLLISTCLAIFLFSHVFTQDLKIVHPVISRPDEGSSPTI